MLTTSYHWESLAICFHCWAKVWHFSYLCIVLLLGHMIALPRKLRLTLLGTRHNMQTISETIFCSYIHLMIQGTVIKDSTLFIPGVITLCTSNTVWTCRQIPMFGLHILPPSSGMKSKTLVSTYWSRRRHNKKTSTSTSRYCTKNH
jgi:hypothetical protein